MALNEKQLSELVYAYRTAHNILASVMTYTQIANQVLKDLDKAKGLLNASTTPTLEQQQHIENVRIASLQNERAEWGAEKNKYELIVKEYQQQLIDKKMSAENFAIASEFPNQRIQLANKAITEIDQQLRSVSE